MDQDDVRRRQSDANRMYHDLFHESHGEEHRVPKPVDLGVIHVTRYERRVDGRLDEVKDTISMKERL